MLWVLCGRKIAPRARGGGDETQEERGWRSEGGLSHGAFFLPCISPPSPHHPICHRGAGKKGDGKTYVMKR